MRKEDQRHVCVERASVTYSLPKGEENDKFDAQDLEERSMFSQVFFELDVELDETVHRAKHCQSVEHLDPDMRKCRIVGIFAVLIKVLRHNRDNGKDNADQAVLENTEVYDLVVKRQRIPLGTQSSTLHLR